MAEDALPLEGVRILDLTTTLAGPSATRVLADFGAEVIKVESRARIDGARLGPPFRHDALDPDASGYFATCNAGKKSFALDLKHPSSRQVLRDLVVVSDVLVESFTPGVMHRLGLDAEVLHNWQPGLIIASHSLQGQNGPRAETKGYGHLASAQTGWFAVTGEQDRVPSGPFSAYTDFLSWPALAGAIMLALEQQAIVGAGVVIDHSHVESSSYFLAPELVGSQLGDPPVARGNRERYACPSGVFPCSGPDEWCAITIDDDRQWNAMCQVIGLPVEDEERWATFADRAASNDEVERTVASLTRAWEAATLALELGHRGIPAANVARARDLLEDPQLIARRALRRLSSRSLGEHVVHAPSFSIDGIASGPSSPAPQLGEDTHRICRDVLGYTDSDIADLESDEVLR